MNRASCALFFFFHWTAAISILMILQSVGFAQQEASAVREISRKRKRQQEGYYSSLLQYNKSKEKNIGSTKRTLSTMSVPSSPSVTTTMTSKDVDNMDCQDTKSGISVVDSTVIDSKETDIVAVVPTDSGTQNGVTKWLNSSSTPWPQGQVKVEQTAGQLTVKGSLKDVQQALSVLSQLGTVSTTSIMTEANVMKTTSATVTSGEEDLTSAQKLQSLDLVDSTAGITVANKLADEELALIDSEVVSNDGVVFHIVVADGDPGLNPEFGGESTYVGKAEMADYVFSQQTSTEACTNVSSVEEVVVEEVVASDVQFINVQTDVSTSDLDSDFIVVDNTGTFMDSLNDRVFENNSESLSANKGSPSKAKTVNQLLNRLASDACYKKSLAADAFLGERKTKKVPPILNTKRKTSLKTSHKKHPVGVSISEQREVNINVTQNADFSPGLLPLVGPVQCDLCKEFFEDDDAVRNHMQDYHYSKDGGVRRCDVCMLAFPDKHLLRVHLESHEGRDVSCKICNKKFQCQRYLRTHIQRHAGVKRFACLYCGWRFFENHKLKFHMESHKEEAERNLPYTCHSCGKKFVSKAAWSDHCNTHSGERPFQCLVCSARFSHRVGLKRHELTHKKIKPHKCHICEKTFTVKPKLVEHLTTHTGVSKHVCPHCDKVFTAAFSLKRHEALCSKRILPMDSMETVLLVQTGPTGTVNRAQPYIANDHRSILKKKKKNTDCNTVSIKRLVPSNLSEDNLNASADMFMRVDSQQGSFRNTPIEAAVSQQESFRNTPSAVSQQESFNNRALVVDLKQESFHNTPLEAVRSQQESFNNTSLQATVSQQESLNSIALQEARSQQESFSNTADSKLQLQVDCESLQQSCNAINEDGERRAQEAAEEREYICSVCEACYPTLQQAEEHLTTHVT